MDRPFPLLLFTDDPGRLVRTTTTVLERDFGDGVREGVIRPDRLADFFDPALVHHAPPLARDLTADLADAGVEATTIDEANALWRDLVDRQSPHPLELADTANAAAPTSADRPAGDASDAGADIGVDADNVAALDRAIAASGDPVPLFRARIALLTGRGDQAELAAWLGRWHDQRPDDPFLAWERAKAEWAAGDREAAVRHAETAARLVPSWAEPPARLAEWAWTSGNWQEAANRYRGLYGAQRAVNRAPDLAAQLFFDRGDGFAAGASITRRLDDDAVAFTLTSRDLSGKSLDRGVHRLRLDPANQPAVVSDVVLQVSLSGGETVSLDCSGDNALFRHEGAWHFETDDPQLHFDLGPLAPADLDAIAVSFTLRHRGDAVRAANYSALVALAGQLEAARRVQGALEDLEPRRRAVEEALAEVRDSLGAGLSRSLLAPLTLGRGPAALDQLGERWRSLDDLLQSLADTDGD
jgi:tetratricopeptide (TPR) repeat protein